MAIMIGYLIGRLIGAFLISLLLTWIWSFIYRAAKKKPLPRFWLKVVIIAVVVTLLSMVGIITQQPA